MLNIAKVFTDLEWKLTYVGSATSAEHDQELDSLLVGPVPVGVNKFMFEADAPDLNKIQSSDVLGVTVILLTCSYDGREFVRVGYYVNNEYDSEDLQNEPPAKPLVDRIRRNILAEKPRVTRFAIKWYVRTYYLLHLLTYARDSEDSAPAEYPPDQPEADTLDDDGTNYGAEEAEMQAALERELADEEAKAKVEDGDDKAMAGTDDKDDDAVSETGSEDLEAESSDDDDEEEEEEAEAAEGDEDVEMGDGDEKAVADSKNGDTHAVASKQEVMAH